MLTEVTEHLLGDSRNGLKARHCCPERAALLRGQRGFPVRKPRGLSVQAAVWYSTEARAGRKDPDMLFFQRRLVVEGDTELGLAVKNLLGAIEPDAVPAILRKGLQPLAAVTESGMTQDASLKLVREENSC